MVRVRTPSIVESWPRLGPPARSMPSRDGGTMVRPRKEMEYSGEALPLLRSARETSIRIRPSGEVAAAGDRVTRPAHDSAMEITRANPKTNGNNRRGIFGLRNTRLAGRRVPGATPAEPCFGYSNPVLFF